MNEYTPTTDQIMAAVSEYGAPTFTPDEVARWLAAHDAEVRAAERERIIQDMQERSHPDDWGVPCVYVSSYAKRLRGDETNG